MNNQVLVQSILNAMQAAITKHGLDLMQTYPDDLLVHDKSMLDRMAVPGAKLAWMAGHCHTHLVNLGLHPDENLTVGYLTNLTSADRFYVIDVKHGEKFSMVEVNRKEFAALSSTAVHYERQGDKADFWLMRQKNRVGHIALKSVGTLHQPKFAATITPVAGISGLDRAALELWCSKAATEIAHSLFVCYEVNWGESYQIPVAA